VGRVEVGQHDGDDGPVEVDHPVVGEGEAHKPKQEVDVEEEEEVGEEERAVVAPLAGRRGEAVGEEREIEEDGGERDKEGNDGVLERPHWVTESDEMKLSSVCVFVTEIEGGGQELRSFQ